MPNMAIDRGKQKILFGVPYALRKYHKKIAFHETDYTDSLTAYPLSS